MTYNKKLREYFERGCKCLAEGTIVQPLKQSDLEACWWFRDSCKCSRNDKAFWPM